MQVARRLDSQLAESILESNGQPAFEKLATATLEKLMPRIEGKGEFGQAKLKWVYAPQIPTLISGATVDPFTLLADNLKFSTDVEVQLGKRIQVVKIKLLHISNHCFPRTGFLLISAKFSCQ